MGYLSGIEICILMNSNTREVNNFPNTLLQASQFLVPKGRGYNRQTLDSSESCIMLNVAERDWNNVSDYHFKKTKEFAWSLQICTKYLM